MAISGAIEIASSMLTMVISLPLNRIFFPTDFADATGINLLIGKFLDSNKFRISVPTNPVAPTTATLIIFVLNNSITLTECKITNFTFLKTSFMLKKLTIKGFIIFFSISSFAQGFSDNFSDGDFTANPIWIGETIKFQIDASNQLQLNDAGTNSPAYLVTQSNVVSNATWEFYVHFDFAPSTSNYGQVYLMSSNSDLTGSLDGYYLKIGGISGSNDDVSLYRQNGTSSTLLIDGVDATVGSDPVDLKIKVTRDSIGEWELFTDLTATGNAFNSEGVFTDNTISQSAYFGVLCRYTSTRSDKFFFDDFSVTGQAFQDITPPVANSIQLIGNNIVELSFNEKLNAVTANNPANYFANKSLGNPSIAQIQTDSSKVQLTFASNFLNGEEYELGIKNVSDQSGNVIQNDTLGFLYFIPVAAMFRDLVINEFMADPSPPKLLPNAEFIEIYNASNKVFDLTNWTLGDGSSSATLTNYILKPNDYLIVCKQSDEALFSSFGDVQGQVVFPSLNNSGDKIVLTDPNGNTIDELEYDLTWYNDFNKELGGWTIEQINPFTHCFGKNNFNSSNSSIGGTPGQKNSIYDTLPDNIAPELLSATVISSDSILLNFSELIDSTTSTLISNFSLSTSGFVAQVRNQPPSYTQVLLILSTPIDSGVINTITVTNIKDCEGNLISIKNSTEVVIPASPSFRDIVINEFFADPSPTIGLPDAEFIEIYNASTKIFDLTGWTIGDASTVSTLSQVIFSPGDYLVVCDQGSAAAYSAFGNTQGQSSFPSLTNSGDKLILKDISGNIIDELTYTSSWYGSSEKSDGGYSLEQINPNKPCTGQNNFKASNAIAGGTPGKINSVFDISPDIIGPKILNVFVHNQDSISIEFDEFLDLNSIDTTEFSFSDSNMVLASMVLEPENRVVGLKLLNQLDSGKIVSIRIRFLADCSGNLILENLTNVALPQKVSPNDVIINEILFNPRAGGSDFVEIFNRSNKVLSVQNWKMANYVGDSISNIETISNDAYLLFPKEYLVFTEDKNYVVESYPNARASRIIEIDDLPSYNDDEGRVYLMNENIIVLDSVSYTDDMQFALLESDEGVTLERLDPNRSSADESNFHSASENEGFGTPGYVNSQFFSETKFSGEITIDPELFSPDNDGYKDNLNVNYKFLAPGFVANVTIYDEQGRIIRRLVKNELLGAQGSITWDGIADDGSKARIGVYLIFFEVFNISGDKEIYKEACVVAGQL
jgi:hypothetical protein